MTPAPVLHCPDCEDGWTWAQDSDGLNPDNDGYECTDDNDNNDDGDLGTIMHWAYGASFRGSAGFLDLFRRTADAVPPVSTVETTRTDGQPMREWNNSNVMVKILSATDYPNPYLRASGVWKRWGKVDGQTPGFTPDADQTPYWIISADGEHQVELLSTDMMGNVETGANDFVVKVDQTPPELTFPNLRPNYLTSQSFTTRGEFIRLVLRGGDTYRVELGDQTQTQAAPGLVELRPEQSEVQRPRIKKSMSGDSYEIEIFVIAEYELSANPVAGRIL